VPFWFYANTEKSGILFSQYRISALQKRAVSRNIGIAIPTADVPLRAPVRKQFNEYEPR